ncbi:HipA domain-containing protein [uncultured Dokdonia sp.]|uniref:HipA domain-containing protein n=1 Tax=uncultured Dokdonia sp. TaxID=575653 RepID=UPI0030EF4EC1|tara:strand:+ start:910 stop:1845 length:936 start_codon:yes stop_codon:yes gene_type:complete
MSKCLYCYKETSSANEFHEQCALDFFGTKELPEVNYSFHEMQTLAKDVVERSISVPGVQPKLSMSLSNNEENKHNQRLTVVGALGGNYIFKPPNSNFIEMPENEHLTMRIAEAYGINVVKSSLIRLKSGELSYITKRIDREANGSKIHMIDMYQITEAFDKYKSSMERVGKALGNYASNTLLDTLYLFELTLFSFITGNNDMHLKNFSMIKTDYGWALSPAYDLLNVAIVNPDDNEEMALTIAGKKKKITKLNFTDFGIKLGLTNRQINSAFSRFQKNRIKANTLIDASFLSIKMKENYLDILQERYDRLT